MSSEPQQQRWRISADQIAGICAIGAAALVVSILSARCWPVLVLDGMTPILVLAAAWGWGSWPANWLLQDRLTELQRGCVALGLGLGVTGAMTLSLGMLGLLSRITAAALVGGGFVAGLAWLSKMREATLCQTAAPSMPRRGVVCGLLVLPVGYSLGMLLFLATLPPGMVWSPEGFGYDVLEYHLQAPREYFDAGAIHFLAHNVYANFPQQVEIHYLLLMQLIGSAGAAAISAQIFHAALTIAAVFSAGAFAAPGWARSVTWLVVGTIPALGYTGCLAYVEGGMVLYAVLTAGVAVCLLRAANEVGWRAWCVVGLLAGLAGGCKYTALALVAAPLVIGLPLVLAGGVRRRVAVFATLVLATGVGVAPWLVRNTIFTGNPVFPFAYNVFGGAAWSAAQNEQWALGHALPEESRSLPGRVQLANQQVLQTRIFGSGFLLLALIGAIVRWDRATWLLLGWSGAMVVMWMMLTHMPWRFLMPLIAPLAILLGQLLDWRGSGFSLYDTHARHDAPIWLRTPVVVLAVVAALWQANTTRGLVAQAERDNQKRFGAVELDLASTVGATNFFRDGHPVNRYVPADGFVWQIGSAAVFYVDRRQHYCVTFNRDPWLEFAAEHSPVETLDFLRSKNVTHVVFSWSEIERLRKTYGFSPLVTREWLATLVDAGLTRIDEMKPQPAFLEVYTVTAKISTAQQ